MLREFWQENFCRYSVNVSNGKQRIEFIDLAKGICILLVVCMHGGLWIGAPMIEALRMPLFFVLSGFFFKDYGSLYNFFIKKTNSLLVPLLFFMLIEAVIILMLSPHLFIGSVIAPFIKPTMINFPLWFLICLFWVSMFYYFIHTHIENIHIKFGVVLTMGVMGYVLSCYEIYLPLFMSTAFTATPFFFTGVIIRKLPLLDQTKHSKSVLALGVSLIVATTTYCLLNDNPRIGFVQNTYSGNIVEIYAVCLGSILGLLIICKYLKWLPIYIIYGQVFIDCSRDAYNL